VHQNKLLLCAGYVVSEIQKKFTASSMVIGKKRFWHRATNFRWNAFQNFGISRRYRIGYSRGILKFWV